MSRTKEPMYRVANILADGRKVYISKRGLIHLQTRAEAEETVALFNGGRGIDKNECVYAQDLGIYGSRSLFLENLRPFVRVVDSVAEPDTQPVDPAAFVLGPISAAKAGVYIRDRPRA